MLGLRRRIAIFCAKSVGMIIRKCSSRRGSVLPGYVAQQPQGQRFARVCGAAD